MHTVAHKPPKQPQKEQVWEIRDLTGKVHETRSTYWDGLIRGYMLLKCGKFTVEERK